MTKAAFVIGLLSLTSCLDWGIREPVGDGDADVDSDADSDGDPCSGVNCSGHGRCFSDDDEALCICDDGYRADGLACLPDGADGDADSDIDADVDVDSDADGDSDADTDICVDQDDDGVCADIDCDDSPTTGSGCSDDCTTVYRDGDDDGFGDMVSATSACMLPTGFVTNGLDCNDSEGDIHPGALDLCGDDEDGDCDGSDRACPASGDILITEIMANPEEIIDTHGEWFELYNSTTRSIELSGLVVRDDDSDRHVIEGSVLVEPRSFVVFVRAEGATARWDYVFNGVSFANTEDELVLETSDGEIIAEISYTADDSIPVGASFSLDPDSFTRHEASDLSNWCTSVSTFSTGDRGTPRRPNDPCGGPGVSGVTPNEGLNVGGLEVTIFGSGLADATNVLIGGTAALSFSVASDGEITATTPAHIAGRVDVTVRTLAGDMTLADAFLYTGTDSTVEWCNVEWPSSTTIPARTVTELLFGRVRVVGVTEEEGECGTGLVAHVGYGALDSDPSVMHGWVWSEALCNRSCTGCDDADEYMRSLTIDTPGDYAYAYRFSTDGGINYRYCDTSGSSEGDSYDPASQGRISVTSH